jgi:hypothetical protein
MPTRVAVKCIIQLCKVRTMTAFKMKPLWPSHAYYILHLILVNVLLTNNINPVVALPGTTGKRLFSAANPESRIVINQTTYREREGTAIKWFYFPRHQWLLMMTDGQGFPLDCHAPLPLTAAARYAALGPSVSRSSPPSSARPR